MRVFITGATGQLGREFCSLLHDRHIPHFAAGKEDFDIVDAEQTLYAIRDFCPDLVINCAAYTHVDAAEDNEQLCMAVNVDGTANVARACLACGAAMMSFSTDYVFDGIKESPYEIGDPINPLSVYGQSKALGEHQVRANLDRHYIIRTSWLFGKYGMNFVKRICMLASTRKELAVVGDQVGSPTYSKDLALLALKIAQVERFGTYQATNEGFCSWADFARAILLHSGQNCYIHSIPSAEYPSRAKRPYNSRLSKDSLIQNGFELLPNWQNALERFFNEWQFDPEQLTLDDK